MHHNVLIDWFSTNKGQILQEQEIEFLIRSITVSCKQVILQIGDLGWNSQYIDCSLYQQFYILKTGSSPSIPPHPFLHGEAHVLPFKSESVDMIILPHLLDFHQNKHSILREVERILKPEGKLIILGFNPWNIYINLQYIRRRDKLSLWHPSLLSRTRLTDWLHLLNFEVDLAAGFNFDAMRKNIGHAEQRKQKFSTVSYAVKAIKRHYRLIPLLPVRNYQPKPAMAKLIEMPIRKGKYDENS